MLFTNKRKEKSCKIKLIFWNLVRVEKTALSVSYIQTCVRTFHRYLAALFGPFRHQSKRSPSPQKSTVVFSKLFHSTMPLYKRQQRLIQGDKVVAISLFLWCFSVARRRRRYVDFYDLRHTLATMALSRGVDVKPLSVCWAATAPDLLSTPIRISPTICREAWRRR